MKGPKVELNPSPKVHLYDTMNPPGSELVDPSKLTCCPVVGFVGEKVKLAVGCTLKPAVLSLTISAGESPMPM